MKNWSFDTDEGKQAFWHSASHVLAQAVKRLYPEARLAIGPAIANGFYYDFDIDITITPEVLAEIEGEMKKIVKENLSIERFELPRDKALGAVRAAGEIYKEELISDLPEDAVISFYRQGEFTDLCAGPHLDKTARIKAFRLTHTAGAYWRGDEKNKMLKRIYGTAFPNATLLAEYLAAVEEAKKRDHNRLGRELGIFTTSEIIGQGLPLFMPKGAKIMQILQRFVEDEEERRGYIRTLTPYLAKSDLYKVSGHWDHYRDGMFLIGDGEDEEGVYALRPMTCPFQFVIYNGSLHSYRDLPLRYAETSTLFRNEASGEMHGLIRVRQFTISEGHIICTPEQLADEFKASVDLIDFMMETLGIKDDITYRFSKWDPAKKDKYIGDEKDWESTQAHMKKILDSIGIKYAEAEGEAAFYGPKLDIQAKNVHGKEDTIMTVQVDFLQPERFDMVYIDKNNEKKRPFIIHRTSIGCYERTLAMLIEKYAGAFPVWLAPVQAKILPIAERHHEYAAVVRDKLLAAGVRAEIDLRNEKVGYKIREAQIEKVPYMLVIGDKEVSEGALSVRSRRDGDLGAQGLDEFLAAIIDEIETRRL